MFLTLARRGGCSLQHVTTFLKFETVCLLLDLDMDLDTGILAYGRLSKINILADKPIPAERSEGPCEQSGLAAGGIAPGGMPPVDHPGGPWEIDFILIEPRNNLAFILFRSG